VICIDTLLCICTFVLSNAWLSSRGQRLAYMSCLHIVLLVTSGNPNVVSTDPCGLAHVPNETSGLKSRSNSPGIGFLLPPVAEMIGTALIASRRRKRFARRAGSESRLTTLTVAAHLPSTLKMRWCDAVYLSALTSHECRLWCSVFVVVILMQSLAVDTDLRFQSRMDSLCADICRKLYTSLLCSP